MDDFHQHFRSYIKQPAHDRLLKTNKANKAPLHNQSGRNAPNGGSAGNGYTG
jgi:hypothetical protein